MSTTKKFSLDEIIEAGHDEESAAMVQALCQHLDCEPSDLTEERCDHYGLKTFSYGRSEYAIGDDEQADEAAAENIKQSAWAFRASFVRQIAGLPSEADEMIQAFQEKKCEDANETILALVGDVDAFVEAAIRADGRGHFLSSYDGAEQEEEADGTTFYIYRTN